MSTAIAIATRQPPPRLRPCADPQRLETRLQLLATETPAFVFGSPFAVGPRVMVRVPGPRERVRDAASASEPEWLDRSGFGLFDRATRFIDRAEFGEVEPGHVRVESASGEPVRVRVDDEGSGTRIAVLGAAGLFRDVGGRFVEQPLSAVFEGESFEIVTPADLRVEGGGRYHVRLTPTDPEARLRVRAVGGPPYGFESTAANAAVVVLAGSPESGGIRGLPYPGRHRQ